MKTELFNSERSDYYRAKKRELARKQAERRTITEDAVYVHYYGMTAYLELFPEAKGFSIVWHEQLVQELRKIKQNDMATMLVGISLAYASSQSKKGGRAFKNLIKELTN